MDNGTTGYSFSPNKGNEVDNTAMTSPTGEQALDNDIQPNKPDDQETERDLDKPYLEKRSVTINLIANYSFYRRANDKYLPKKHEYIGSSFRTSSVLASNKDEVEAYFPNIIGVATNDPTFVTRVKAYLNNMQIEVNEMGKTFDTSFRWRHKRDYLSYKAKEDAIEDRYRSIRRDDIQVIKKALEAKIEDLNELESTKHQYGTPVNVEDYIKYRHCLLYRDVAKDMALINSDINYRFYFKDDVKENEIIQRRRQEIKNAKRNFLAACGDDSLFEAVYIQYCVADGMPVINASVKTQLEKEIELDNYSNREPAKFNKIFNDKDLKVKALIETLISRGEFIRASDNQNISTAAGDFIGANIKETVLWFKNPANERAVTAFKNKLKYQ